MGTVERMSIHCGQSLTYVPNSRRFESCGKEIENGEVVVGLRNGWHPHTLCFACARVLMATGDVICQEFDKKARNRLWDAKWAAAAAAKQKEQENAEAERIKKETEDRRHRREEAERLRQREAEEKTRRQIKAAICLQCAFRKKKAKRVVERKAAEEAARLKRQEWERNVHSYECPICYQAGHTLAKLVIPTCHYGHAICKGCARDLMDHHGKS